MGVTLESRRVSPRRLPYLERLVRVFTDNRDQIDAAVSSAMDNWRMDRLSLVDRGILRLGATEIICIAEIPGRVAIQEAVRLAQRYGGEDSSRFVNGVLDGVYRTAEDDDSPAGGDDPPPDDGPRPSTIPRPSATIPRPTTGPRHVPRPSP